MLQLFKLIDPRLVIDAHIHHGCYRLHDNGVPEWTVSSFNWRNKQNPAFLLVRQGIDCVCLHLSRLF